MILKIKHTYENTHEDGTEPTYRSVWEFIDNITEFETNSNTEPKADPPSVLYVRDGRVVDRYLLSEAYLLNDNGKTIERLV